MHVFRIILDFISVYYSTYLSRFNSMLLLPYNILLHTHRWYSISVFTIIIAGRQFVDESDTEMSFVFHSNWDATHFGSPADINVTGLHSKKT